MNAALAYAIIAALTVLLVGVLLRQRRNDDALARDATQDNSWDLLDSSGLRLAERIFDCSDYTWLRDEVGQPHLAQTLFQSRQRMAVRWLKSLRRSFDELASTPDPSYSQAKSAGFPSGRHSLWLTVRFHLLLTYALCVVRLFGPYHRLIPSFGWANLLPSLAPQAAARPRSDTGRVF